MQALILAGGEGTRLRPLTSTIPKPVVPLANRPHMVFMIEWLRRHGVDEVILACGFMADDVRRVLGEGDDLGVRLRYVKEPEPLGTGGALAYAGEMLDERFFMLNGDVLSDIDLGQLLVQHEQTGAQATITLVEVEDPSMYGLVRLEADRSVSAFVEKPSAEQEETAQINAGAYALERSILEYMPAPGTNVSIERDVFPKLVGNGLFGFPADGYWLDIGTPERYLQGTFDILKGNVATELGEQLAHHGHVLAEGDGAQALEDRLIAPALAAAGATVDPAATVGGCVTLGRDVVIGEGAQVERSVLLDGARVGAHTTVRSSILAPQASVGAHCRLDGAVLGQGVELGDHNALKPGARLFPGDHLPDGAMRS